MKQYNFFTMEHWVNYIEGEYISEIMYNVEYDKGQVRNVNCPILRMNRAKSR